MTPREVIEVILALAILVAPIALLIQRARAKTPAGVAKGIGVRVVQFLGVATLLPALLILALERIIDGPAVAALVGAFVGYLFSGVAEFDRRPSLTAEKPE